MGDKRSEVPKSVDEETSSDRKRRLPSESMSRNSMLENLHNVERRVHQPQKKVKRLSEDLESGTKPKTTHAHRGNGIVGEYMRPDPESTEPGQTSVPRAVDLTKGEFKDNFITISVHGLESNTRGLPDSDCKCLWLRNACLED